MGRSKSDYFGLDHLVSIILAIIPFTSWILGILTRFNEGKILAGIIRIFFGFNIIWILDIFFMITQGHILKIIDA